MFWCYLYLLLFTCWFVLGCLCWLVWLVSCVILFSEVGCLTCCLNFLRKCCLRVCLVRSILLAGLGFRMCF